MDVQDQKAFQKQKNVFVAKSKRVLANGGSKKDVKKLRWFKNVGLGFKTPQAAIDGEYIDKNCPFTGQVSIRGRVLKGMVISTKMERTVVLRRDMLHYIKKYKRYEKRHKNMSAHLSPAFGVVKEGDVVTVGECRPLSKTVRFNVLNVKACSTRKPVNAKKMFVLF